MFMDPQCYRQSPILGAGVRRRRTYSSAYLPDIFYGIRVYDPYSGLSNSDKNLRRRPKRRRLFGISDNEVLLDLVWKCKNQSRKTFSLDF